MSPPLAGDISALLPLLRQLQLEQAAIEKARASNAKPFHESGLKQVTINLASDLPFVSKDTCFGFHILRRSSHVGARLKLKTGGDAPLGPGDWVRGRLEQGWILEQNGGAAIGTVTLMLVMNPQARFWEYSGSDIEKDRQVLLGSINSAGVPSYVTVAENTDPTTLLATDGVFDASGFRAIELYIDGGAANTLTTVDLIPWSLASGMAATYWSQQYDQLKSLGDTNPTAGRYRMVAWSLDGAVGYSYFSIRNLAPAAATGLGFLVVGVR